MSMWVPNSESGPKIQSLEGENEIPQIGIIIQKLQCSLVNCLRIGRKAVKTRRGDIRGFSHFFSYWEWRVGLYCLHSHPAVVKTSALWDYSVTAAGNGSGGVPLDVLSVCLFRLRRVGCRYLPQPRQCLGGMLLPEITTILLDKS